MPTIPVLRLEGVIAARGGRQGLSAQALERPLARAFAQRGPAVALILNSPGGSAAQSEAIARRVRALARRKGKTVLAFVEDVAASGGYWLATAADEIYALETAIVGSIGVIGASFGFPEALNRLGIERRVHTAGRSKSQLDPFRPENPEDVARLQRLLNGLHDIFIAQVRRARGARLKEAPGMFEGEVFLAKDALALGLIDGIGELRETLEARFGEKVKLKPIAGRAGGLLRRFGLEAADGALDMMEARLAYARYGL